MASLTGRHPMPATTRRVIKALSLFSGVQSISVLVSVIRTKLVALWIGPAGVGLLSLYTWVMQLITTATQFNLGQSAVRTLSQASGDDANRASSAALVRRLALIVGVGGALLTILLSPLLSIINFGDTSHTWSFILLSAMLPLTAAAAAEGALMQGFDHLRRLATSTVVAAVVGTVIAVPLYYFFRIDAIVPVLIFFSLSSCVSAIIWRVRTDSVPWPSLREALRHGAPILGLGIYLTASTFIGLAAVYIFMVYLNRQGGTEAVGLFNSGSTMLNSYVGIIFTAISMEFYPRLSRVASSSMRTAVVVNHESSMALWVILPVIIVVICFGRWILMLLYSDSFEPALPFVTIAIVAMALRAPAWCMAFTMVARGDGRAFLLSESVSAVVYLILNVLLYERYGFIGLGVAYIMWYLVYVALITIIYKMRYGLSLSIRVWAQMVLCIVFAVLAFAGMHFVGLIWTSAVLLPLSGILAVLGIFGKR